MNIFRRKHEASSPKKSKSPNLSSNQQLRSPEAVAPPPSPPVMVTMGMPPKPQVPWLELRCRAPELRIDFTTRVQLSAGLSDGSGDTPADSMQQL